MSSFLSAVVHLPLQIMLLGATHLNIGCNEKLVADNDANENDASSSI